jgi:hypothetical protein
MPFTCIDWFPVPGRAYPLPFVTPLRDLQKEINIAMSQLIELKNRQLRGDMAWRGAGEPHQDTDPETGAKKIRFDPDVLDFQFMQYSLNPTEAEALLVRLHEDAMRVAGIHDPTMGNAPSVGRNVTLGEIQTLKESDMTGLALFRAGMDLSYCKVASLKLLNAKNHYHVPRLLRVVGRQNDVRTAAFMGADLRNTIDVRPRPTPPVSQSIEAQMRLAAYAQGLYGPYMGPPDKYAKLTALLNSGIPDAEQEVREILGGITMQELRQQANAYEELQLQAQVAQAQMMLAQMGGMGGDMGGMEGPPVLDEDGMPVEQEPQMPPEQAMAGQEGLVQ